MIDTRAYVLRPLNKEAMPSLLALYRQCEDFLALGPQSNANEEMILRDLETTRADGGIYSGIYLPTDSRLMGVLDVIPGGFQGNPPKAFIELLMIAAPYRGQGLGSRVVTGLEHQLAAGGVKTICAGVQANNPQAVRFWQKHGYLITAEATLQPDGTTSYMLEKRLSTEGQKR